MALTPSGTCARGRCAARQTVASEAKSEGGDHSRDCKVTGPCIRRYWGNALEQTATAFKVAAQVQAWEDAQDDKEIVDPVRHLPM